MPRTSPFRYVMPLVLLAIVVIYSRLVFPTVARLTGLTAYVLLGVALFLVTHGQPRQKRFATLAAFIVSVLLAQALAR